ncbi:hypothetical protein [Candidatus Nitrotoga sp. AM1P]|uniref:hypothetical protein n=1 Tax=Candidatus Nitrotoga sp. AM1P TaxID=2559597 RepID=UPI0010BA0407|nr:hypothetical protein [Candidatus Nitrotoga sp. AM1P]BBJ24196.1 hypothetical protein W01_21230 [Candidatus Nitrotoga sp. AM1P]
MENLSYALVQVVHNFGAVAVMGGAAFALCLGTVALYRKLAWLVGFGWMAQAMSGMSFAAVSYHYYGKLPDIHGIAMTALLIKMLCAVSGVSIVIIYLRYSTNLTIERQHLAWQLLAALGLIALTAAAFLRWFS